ncbi:MAG: hypothetical protein WBD36_05135 [Bacteroidota bacterium]
MASATAFSQFPSVGISANDWGIQDFSRIRLGQVSLIHTKDGDQLAVYTLRDTILPPPSYAVSGKTPEFSGNYFVVGDYDVRHINDLGGVFNVFQREPSSAHAGLVAGNDGRRCLKLSFDKRDQGFCGLWIHLFNSSQAPASRIYFDSKPFSTLSFWIRVKAGRESVTIKVADSDWLAREDAQTIGDVGNFVAGGKLDTLWRLAIVPLSQFPARINMTRLASLVFEATSAGTGEVDIKTISFSVEPGPFAPLPGPFELPTPRQLDKATWLWNTAAIAGDPAREQELIEFIQKEGITTLFLGIPYDAQDVRTSHAIRIPEEKLRPLLSRLNRLSVKVHALIGDKDFVLPDQQPMVLATLENVIRYNAAAKPEERFAGFHLDVEPYLLPGFNSARQQWIVHNYLMLLSQVSQRGNRAELAVGVDIPYWFDSPDEFSSRIISDELGGVTKPLYQHVIDLMDDVALMSYRTTATGMDGIILQSLDEISYAFKAGKQVFVGLETESLPDENVLTFRGRPTAGYLNPPPSGWHFFLITNRGEATGYLVSNESIGSFQNFLSAKETAQADALHWNISQNVFAPSDKVTFAKLRPTDLANVMKEGSLELEQQPSFQGFAIHHYESYRKFLSQTTPR